MTFPAALQRAVDNARAVTRPLVSVSGALTLPIVALAGSLDANPVSGPYWSHGSPAESINVAVARTVCPAPIVSIANATAALLRVLDTAALVVGLWNVAFGFDPDATPSYWAPQANR